MSKNKYRLARAAIVVARQPTSHALTGKQRWHNDLLAVKSVLTSRAEKAARLDALEGGV